MFLEIIFLISYPPHHQSRIFGQILAIFLPNFGEIWLKIGESWLKNREIWLNASS